MFSRALQFSARRALNSNHSGGKLASHMNNGPYFLRTNPVWQCTLGKVMPGKSIPHTLKTAILLSLVPQTAIYYTILMEEDAINKMLGTEAINLTTECKKRSNFFVANSKNTFFYNFFSLAASVSPLVCLPPTSVELPVLVLGKKKQTETLFMISTLFFVPKPFFFP